jgi:hypothetical protein
MPSKKSQLKLPPQNLEAEQAVLGSVLIDKNAIYRVADILLPEDFYTKMSIHPGTNGSIRRSSRSTKSISRLTC